MPRKARIALASLAFCISASVAASWLSGGKTILDGYLFDVGLATRAALFAAPDSQSDTPVAVIAVDPRSLESPELRMTPRALFAPHWAQLIEALSAANVKTIAFDILLPFRGNDFKDGYDKPFIRALGENRERIVLGRSATTLPAQPLLAALAPRKSGLGMLELKPESDGVYRVIPMALERVGGDVLPSLLGATLQKAGKNSSLEEVLLAPNKHLETIPSYALIDVLRCTQDDPHKIEQKLSGRVVFIGSVLPEEDRKLTSGRFLPSKTASTIEPSSACALDLLGASALRSRTVPGVYLHAAAAEAVMTGNITTTMPLAWSVAITAVAGGAGATVGILLMPWLAFAIVIVVGFLLWLAEMLLLEGLLWYPASPAIIALILSAVLVYSTRYLVVEQRSRRVKRAFGRYLAPTLVEQLAENWKQLKLGGVEREVSVMFADLSGFTALSTRLPAAELVEITNRYLALIVDEVDATGGYVDKFIGDAVMAIWGAPVDNHDHSYDALIASAAIVERIEQERVKAASESEHAFGIKIGIHSGVAIVGNMGSEQRFNYTGVGETVNVASRLESLPGLYNCSVVTGPKTAEAVSGRINLRELDIVMLKGLEEPLTVYQPIAKCGEESNEQLSIIQKYQEALEHYRNRQFKTAHEIWVQLTSIDGPSAVMANRARNFMEQPPPSGWDGVWVVASK